MRALLGFLDSWGPDPAGSVELSTTLDAPRCLSALILCGSNNCPYIHLCTLLFDMALDLPAAPCVKAMHLLRSHWCPHFRAQLDVTTGAPAFDSVFGRSHRRSRKAGDTSMDLWRATPRVSGAPDALFLGFSRDRVQLPCGQESNNLSHALHGLYRQIADKRSNANLPGPTRRVAVLTLRRGRGA